MTYAAILFDMDGTLLDSGPIWKEATIQAFTACSIYLPEEEMDLLAGVALSTFLEERGYGSSYAHIRDIRDPFLHTLITDRLQWHKGAEELISTLSVPIGVITNTPQAIIDAFDVAVDIKKHFGVFLSGDDMKPNFKPHPKGLLLACEKLEVDPTQCVYIGDQESDLLAAKAAGMDAILIKGRQTPKDLAHEKMVEDFAELALMLT